MNDANNNLRTIINKTPRFIILVALLCILILIPYPRSITGDVTLVHFESREVCASGQLPYNYIKKVKLGTFVQVELEGYTIKKDGSLSGYITHIKEERGETSKDSFFSYTILLSINPFMYKGMKGKASIDLPNKNLLMRAIGLFNNQITASPKPDIEAKNTY